MKTSDITRWNLRQSDGVLHLDGVNLELLAEQFGTPLYAVSRCLLETTYDEFMASLAREGVEASVGRLEAEGSPRQKEARL